MVSIIIVNWNGRKHLATCLDSLAAQTFRDFEVILVDNGSTDGSAAFVGESYPWVRLIPLTENSGFATGNNRGFVYAQGEYIVTLNNDTLSAPDWLATLAKVAGDHPRAGMVGSRICSYDDPDLIDSIGVAICRDGMSRGHFRNRSWSSLRMGETEPILFPSACAALYRRTMLEETGFFDDDFFAYAEDTDLGLRGRLAGWEAVAATGAVVLHKYSRSGGAFSPMKVYLVERNHYWVALKTFPLHLLLAVPLFTMVRYAEQLLALLSGHGSGAEFMASSTRRGIALALLRGARDGMGGIPRTLRKRCTVMNTRKIAMKEMSGLLSCYRLSFRNLLDR